MISEKDVQMIVLDPTVIESSAMRQFFTECPLSLSDADLAAIVGNSGATKDKKKRWLSFIAEETEDVLLKEKITKWISKVEGESGGNKRSADLEDFWEDHFVNFMTPFVKGDIVKKVGDDLKHGILMGGGMIMSEAEQQKRIEKMSQCGLPFPLGMLDYSDVQFRVEWLDEDGKFYHEHVNPLYLDNHKPSEDESDYNVLKEAAALVKGDARASLQTFQMACEEFAKGT